MRPCGRRIPLRRIFAALDLWIFGAPRVGLSGAIPRPVMISRASKGSFLLPLMSGSGDMQPVMAALRNGEKGRDSRHCGGAQFDRRVISLETPAPKFV